MKLCRLLLAGIAFGFLTLSARADGLIILPTTDLDIRLRFENLSDYPAYDFYLKYKLRRREAVRPILLRKLDTDVLTRLEGDGNGLIDVYLFAIPRGQNVQVPPRELPFEPTRQWFENAPPGGLQCKLHSKSGRRVSDDDHNSELTYRVSLIDNTLEAKCTDAQFPIFYFRMKIAGIVLTAIALLAVVVVVVNRRFRNR